MSQSITGSHNTVQTLASANATIASGAAVIANGLLGTFSLNNNGSFSPTPVYGAVFAPSSLGTETIHNAGFIEANGAQPLGPYDAGIVIAGTGTLFNTGTVTGNSAVAIFGTSGSDYVSNTKLIAGSYGVGLYLAANSRISNSGTIIGTSGTHINANAIELRGTGFVTNSTTGTIESVGADALELNSTGTVLNAGLITGYGAGVNLRDTGFLSNSSTGTIDGYRIAVGLYGGGTIINAGRIINTGTGGTYNTYAGIELGSYANNPSSYSAAIITNTGTIMGADYGIDAFGTKATVTNSGLILSQAATFTIPSNYGSFTGYAAGIELTNGSSVTNQAGGSIIGYNGIFLGNTGFVSNAGFVSGSLIGSAIFLANSGTVINTGSIHTQEGAGIYNLSGSLTASNSGNITGAYGISARFNEVVTNSGTIITADQAIAEDITQGATNTSTATIINSGILEATATMFAGVGYFTGRTFAGAGIEINGGTVTNQKTGTIIAGGDGIITYFQPATINNAGTIIASGMYGISLGGTGTVANTGLISGYREAIRDKSASATIINSGIIIATGNTFVIAGATSSSNGFPTGTYISHGIQLTHGGTVINQAGGTIEGQTAIDLKGAGEYVANAGLVTATGHAGIYLHNSGSVSDTGTIRANNPAIELYGGGNVTIGNTGLATSSAKSAIYLKQSGTVTNAGTIIGSGPGIQMADGGTVLNTGSITGKAGIAITLASGYVLNQKFVDGTNTSGIYLQDGGTIINTGFAEGSVHGIEIFSGTGIATNTGTIIGATGALFLGQATLTDSGTIIGTAGDAVSFATGLTNRLIIDPGAVFSGTVAGGGGILELAQGAGTIIGLGSSFVNFNTIEFDPSAAWVVTGNTTGLASGQLITGLGANDTIILTGFTETADHYANQQLTLNGSTILDIAGNFSTSSFLVTSSGGNTTISTAAGTVAANTALTLTSASTSFAAGTAVIGNGLLGTFSVNNNGSFSSTPVYGAVFAPASLGTETIHNAGFIETNGAQSLGPYDAGIVIGAAGTVLNTGTIEGNSGLAIFGTSGTDYINNSKLIAGAYGVGMYLAGNASITNSGTVIGNSGTSLSATAIEIRGIAFVSNTSTGTISAPGEDALNLDGFGTVLNAGIINAGLSAHNGAAVRLKAGGFVSNASTGTLTGQAQGIALYNGGTIINAGRIVDVSINNLQPGAGNYGGIYAPQGAIITNSGILIADATGIILENSGSVINSGAILANKYGIYLGGPGTITNLAGGTISGSTGIRLTGADTIINAGTIIGTAGDAVSFATGLANRLIIDPGAVFSSTVAGGGGILELAQGAGTINGLGSSFVNFNTIEFDPSAAWVVTGNTTSLANGELITGFGLNDTIILTGLTETTDTYANQQLTLNGTTILDIAGSFSTSSFLVTTAGGSTTIVADRLANVTISGTTAETIGTGVTVTNPTIAGGTLVLTTGGSVAGTIALTGTGNQLIIEPAANGTTTVPPNTITGFAPGDTIKLAGVPYNAAQDSYTVATPGTVTIDANGTFYNVLIAGVYVGENNFTLNGDIALVDPAICYLAGTRIATPAGEVPVEALSIGDCVITRFNGYRRIKWIGRQSYAARFIRHNFEQIPVRITTGSLGPGVPHRDLLVSPGHSMLIEGQLILAKNLVNGVTILQTPPAGDVHYYQLEFETHDCVLAEGAWSESYADTPDWRAKFHNAAEFFALYPDHAAPAEQTLCAPRHLEGPALEAILRPLATQAASLAAPGRLHGFIETITGDMIAGWAWDEANPQLPVLLEISVHGRRLGSVLACQPRCDLQAAGYAQGQCGFSFTSPLGLPPDHASISVCRARDGAQLPFLTPSRAVA